MNFTIYNNSTGEILRYGVCPISDFDSQITSPSEAIIEGTYNDVVNYIDIVTNTPAIKADLPAYIDKVTMSANGIDVVTISSLPNPSIVILENIFHEVTDGTFEFTVDTAGEYRITCKAFPYLDKEFIINAS